MVECLYVYICKYMCFACLYIYITFVASLHTVPSSYLCFVAVSAPDLAVLKCMVLAANLWPQSPSKSAVAPPESESMPESIKAWSASKSAESMTCPRQEPRPWPQL